MVTKPHLFRNQESPLHKTLSNLNASDGQDSIEAAEAFVLEYDYSAAEAMLRVFLVYKSHPGLNPLFYLEVMNRFRIFTPAYCEPVWRWARAYQIAKDFQPTPYVGLSLAQALSNSPIKPKESASWFLGFLDTMTAARPGCLDQVYGPLKPKVSRAENNVSLNAFSTKEKFLQHFRDRDPSVCAFFFRHYYNFSHLFENKEVYLKALSDLSGSRFEWYGSPKGEE